jgi:hypothetical protein
MPDWIELTKHDGMKFSLRKNSILLFGEWSWVSRPQEKGCFVRVSGNDDVFHVLEDYPTIRNLISKTE